MSNFKNNQFKQNINFSESSVDNNPMLVYRIDEPCDYLNNALHVVQLSGGKDSDGLGCAFCSI